MRYASHEFGRTVDPGGRAVLLLDGAGWYIAADLVVPDNIIPQPPPDRAPVENVRQFLRDNGLGDRIFTSYDNIIGECCRTWKRLVDKPWGIVSIGLPDRVHRL